VSGSPARKAVVSALLKTGLSVLEKPFLTPRGNDMYPGTWIESPCLQRFSSHDYQSKLSLEIKYRSGKRSGGALGARLATQSLNPEPNV